MVEAWAGIASFEGTAGFVPIEVVAVVDELTEDERGVDCVPAGN